MLNGLQVDHAGAVATPPVVDVSGVLGWWRASDAEAKKALVGASLAWMVDMFDVQLYAMVLAAMIVDLGMAKTTGGLLGSLTLFSSAAGGVLFGVFADRWGRTRALITSIAIYSIFTGASGFAQTIGQLAVLRVLLGFGVGGEWASGAAIVSETWPAEYRGKALAFMQSSAAFGKALAALVTAAVLPFWGWRAVFFVGVLPGCLTLWVCRTLKEPAIWRASRADKALRGRFADVFSPKFLRLTIAVTLMNACTMFGWWGLNLWIPAYLSLPIEKGGIGLSSVAMSGLVFTMQIGMWLGYVSFGYASDLLGRKRTYVLYVLSAAVAVLAYVATKQAYALLMLGPFVAFFGSGHFAGFGVVTAEIYPTNIRATAQGFTYNMGRIASAVAPFVVGSLAETHGFRMAMSISAVAFVLAAIAWIWIPETKGRELQ